MAKRMAKLLQGADNETILPVNRGKVKEKDQNYSKRYSDADRTRKDKGLPSPFQDKGQRTLRLATRRPDGRPSPLRLQPSRSLKMDPKEERNNKRTVASRQA